MKCKRCKKETNYLEIDPWTETQENYEKGLVERSLCQDCREIADREMEDLFNHGDLYRNL